MANGIWPSVSGAAAQAQAVDIVANNLANVDSIGYKKDAPTFKEYLAVMEREPGGEPAPHGPITNRDLYPLDGRDQSFVVVDGTYTNFRPGTLKVTQSPLDVAIDGPGFFEVGTPSGVRYTRQGSFKLAMDGRLVTPQGYPVLSSKSGGLAPAQPVTAVQPSQGGLPTQGGVAVEQITADITARSINLRDLGRNVSINQQGQIYAGDQLVGQLSIAEFKDPRKLMKTGGQLFKSNDPQNFSEGPIGKSKILQGVLEGSNVNPVEEMANMIKANRLFEHDLKAIKSYNDLLGREANDIGKL